MFAPLATNLVQLKPSQPWGFKDKSLVMTRITDTFRLSTGLSFSSYFLVDLPSLISLRKKVIIKNKKVKIKKQTNKQKKHEQTLRVTSAHYKFKNVGA